MGHHAVLFLFGFLSGFTVSASGLVQFAFDDLPFVLRKVHFHVDTIGKQLVNNALFLFSGEIELYFLPDFHGNTSIINPFQF